MPRQIDRGILALGQRPQPAHRRRHRRPAAGSAGHPGIGARPRAARPLLFNLHRARRRVRRAWADAVYAGTLQPWAATYLNLTVEIVKRPPDQRTFQVLPRRWVVERTLAWITSYRRCARDYERLPACHEATVYWAMITVMTRRLARSAEVRNKY